MLEPAASGFERTIVSAVRKSQSRIGRVKGLCEGLPPMTRLGGFSGSFFWSYNEWM
jgi:hypothetical protein